MKSAAGELKRSRLSRKKTSINVMIKKPTLLMEKIRSSKPESGLNVLMRARKLKCSGTSQLKERKFKLPSAKMKLYRHVKSKRISRTWLVEILLP